MGVVCRQQIGDIFLLCLKILSGIFWLSLTKQKNHGADVGPRYGTKPASRMNMETALPP